MGAFVIEIQNNVIVTPISYHNEAEVQSGVAKQDYYQKCGTACVSTIERHIIILMSEDGNIIKKETFSHIPTINEE